MTLQASVGYKPSKHMMKVYAPTLERETLKSFVEGPVKSDVKVYGTLHRYSMICEVLNRAAIADIGIREYMTPSTIELVSFYDKLFSRHILQQPMKKSEPMRESLSTLKPEIIGLGLGGILSFGISMFALATDNAGLATVMAGPFLASVLGFTLLLIGLKRKR